MTKREKDKCEELLNEAAFNLEKADAEWKDYEDAKTGGYDDDEEFSLRQFENHRGYSEGIYHALAVLGYKSEKMMKISKRI